MIPSLLFWAAVVLTSYATFGRLSQYLVPEGELTSIPAEFGTLLAVIAMKVLLIQFLLLETLPWL